jgi:hypothetical protein
MKIEISDLGKVGTLLDFMFILRILCSELDSVRDEVAGRVFIQHSGDEIDILGKLSDSRDLLDSILCHCLSGEVTLH